MMDKWVQAEVCPDAVPVRKINEILPHGRYGANNCKVERLKRAGGRKGYVL